MNYKKGFSVFAAILVVIIIIAVGFAAYLIGKNTNQKIADTNQNNTGTTVGCTKYTPDDWNILVPQVRTEFLKAYGKSMFEQNGTLTASSIVKTGDVTGDCTNEALIGLESGGASNEAFGIAMYQNGAVVVPQTKEDDGTINPAALLRGGSVMHQENGDFIDGVGYYTIEKQNDGTTGQVASCTVTAYQWNSVSNMFEYATDLTTKWQKNLCGDTPSVSDAGNSNQSATACKNSDGGRAIITNLSKNSGKIGDTVTVSGCNFRGFEGQANVGIENSKGVSGILFTKVIPLSQTTDSIMFKLQSPICQQDNSYSGNPCTSWLTLSPGTYNIIVSGWNTSNKMPFIIN